METSFIIQNLKCGGCENTIVTQLSKLEGISEVKVVVEESTVQFGYQNLAQVEAVGHTLSELGYPVQGDKNTLGKKVKSYVSCMIGRVNQ
ncbi:MAG: heavy-metal-associated domain-containing protein [Flavobacteriaceae bacterium]|nr:heavy-metal-associated domain-containing protein [Flavobacteriaceae bacterium]